MQTQRAQVIVVSDRCAAGIETDRSGAKITQGLREGGWSALDPVIVPDEAEMLRDAMLAAVDAGADLIVTSGSTGVSVRDVAPEATEPIISRRLPALEALITNASLAQTPYAAFGRGLCGIHDGKATTLVINMPGSVKAAELFLDLVPPLLGHFYEQLHTNPDDKKEGRYREHPTS